MYPTALYDVVVYKIVILMYMYKVIPSPRVTKDSSSVATLRR